MFAALRDRTLPRPLSWLRGSRAVTFTVGGIVLAVVAGSAALADVNYLLFHSLAELFAITIGLMIGVVAWYTFSFSRNFFLAFLGAAYPFIALIDLFHTLAYSGMGVFPADTNLPTQLWIAARALEAAALVIAPRYLDRVLPIGRAFGVFAVVTAAVLGLIATGYFPAMHLPGQGLTGAKIGAEYLIIILLAVTGIRLWRRRLLLDAEILSLITATLVLTATAELLFTFYIGVYDLSNLLGHIAKLASFALVFIALIRTSLQQPFRILTRNSTTYDAIPDEIVVVDEAGLIRQVNRVVEERYGQSIKSGDDSHVHFHPANLQKQDCAACSAIAAGVGSRLELFYPDEQRWQQISLAPIHDPYAARGIVQVLHDVTDLKEVQFLLQRSNRALRAISASNHALVHATDERRLLEDVCRIVVEKGGYRMAWVGFPDEGPERGIVPQAWAGREEGFLTELGFSWGDTLLGRGPEGAAIRSGKAVFVNAIDADPTFEPWRKAAVSRDYAAVIAFPLVAREQSLGVFGIYAAEADIFQNVEIELLQELAGDLAYGINALRTGAAREMAERRARYWYRDLSGVLKQTVAAVAGLVEMRDPYTAGHQRRVAELAVAIGRELKLDEERLEGLSVAGLIHDVGKLHIPTEILTRPGTLGELEFNLIQVHPSVGYRLLRGIAFPWPVAEMVRDHHERLDGSGYPGHLQGDAIRLESRILSVADTLDAIASHRPYRPAWGIATALGILESGAGTLYDPEAVRACARLFREERFPTDAYVKH